MLFRSRRVLADVEIAIEPLELLLLVDVIIVLQHGDSQALAESAGTDKEEVFVGIFYFLDEPGLIDIVTVVFADGHEVHHPVGDALGLGSCCSFFHNYDALEICR